MESIEDRSIKKNWRTDKSGKLPIYYNSRDTVAITDSREERYSIP